MKKIMILFLMLSLMLCLPVQAQEEADPSVLSGCHSLLARVPMEGQQLLPTAKSVILYELNSQSLVHSWNADELIDPTGMVKFMTVLLALENGSLDAPVTVTSTALDSVAWGAVSADLTAGEVLPLKELLYCVMVASANDACAVIAEHIAGSQRAFVEMMNEKARALGCENTVFADPHGLAATGQTSTARELAIIVAAALENPDFVELNGTKEHTVPATNLSRERKLFTTNHMLSKATMTNYYDERVTGGKPAAVSLKDRSMICTAESGGQRFLCVVMGAQSVLTADETTIISHSNFTETQSLLDYAFAKYSVQQVIDRSQVLCQYGVSGGENDVVMHPSGNVVAVLPVELDMSLLTISERVDPSRLVAPIRKGDVLGTVHVSYGSVVLGSCQLLAMHDVAGEGTSIRPAAPVGEENAAGVSLGKLLLWLALAAVAVVVLPAVCLVTVRFVRALRIRASRKRRRRERTRRL